jgi:hypothetical protein
MALSSFCSNSQGCVDVWVEGDGLVRVANSHDPELTRPVVTFDEDEWLAFTQGAHNNEFEYRNLERR